MNQVIFLSLAAVLVADYNMGLVDVALASVSGWLEIGSLWPLSGPNLRWHSSPEMKCYAWIEYTVGKKGGVPLCIFLKGRGSTWRVIGITFARRGTGLKLFVLNEWHPCIPLNCDNAFYTGALIWNEFFPHLVIDLWRVHRDLIFASALRGNGKTLWIIWTRQKKIR